MKTTHEIARELLAMPDTVLHPRTRMRIDEFIGKLTVLFETQEEAKTAFELSLISSRGRKEIIAPVDMEQKK